MITQETIEGLKKKFTEIHPLVFYRSFERAKTGGELFDILDAFPKEFPVVWNEETKRWVTTKDIYQSANFSPKDNS
jgi:hypothetical protein